MIRYAVQFNNGLFFAGKTSRKVYVDTFDKALLYKDYRSALMAGYFFVEGVEKGTYKREEYKGIVDYKVVSVSCEVVE